jgi:hypothetical protein
MWTRCNRKLAKAGKIRRKILFPINKLPEFAHHEDVRTDSDTKAKARAKKKTAKKPAAKKRKARR